MLFRARSDDDLGAIGAVVERANECDGYPPHWPGPVESFLVTPETLVPACATPDNGFPGRVNAFFVIIW